MRTVIVSNLMSLDGFVGNDDDSTAQLPIGPDDVDFHRYNLERLRGATTVVSGRRSYETFEAHWPDVENDPDAGPIQREISHLNNRAEQLVISDSYRVSPDSPWASSTRVIGRQSAAVELGSLKTNGTDDIVIFGSPTAWDPLLAAGVVDELHLLVAPVLIGSGVPAFRHGMPDQLHLDETRTYSKSGMVLLRYRTTPPSSSPA